MDASPWMRSMPPERVIHWGVLLSFALLTGKHIAPHKFADRGYRSGTNITCCRLPTSLEGEIN